MYPYNYIRGCQPTFRNSVNKVNNEEDRSLLLPLLFGAAVGFPLGFIASNNKNQGYYPQYQQPYYPQPVIYQQPYYPQQIPYQQPYYY